MLLVDRRGVDGARALTGAAGALLLLTACGGSTGPVGGATPGASSSETAASPAPVPPLTTYELVKGVTVDVPASWRSADYLATPATVYFPLRFFIGALNMIFGATISWQ